MAHSDTEHTTSSHTSTWVAWVVVICALIFLWNITPEASERLTRFGSATWERQMLVSNLFGPLASSGK